jgi:DNA polymerase III subunit epsilon
MGLTQNTTTTGPWWERLAAIDTETTGTNVNEDRIVTAAFIRRGPGQILTHEWLINPGIDIPAAASAIHGVTTEHARTHGMEPAEALCIISASITDAAEHGIALVAFNARFDIPILVNEFRLHGIEQPIWPAIIDPLIVDKHIDKFRSGSRRLDAVCARWGVNLVNAHSAAGDALAALMLAQVVLERGRDVEPFSAMTPRQLHATQQGWYDEQANSLRAFWQGRGDERWKTVTNGWPLPSTDDEATESPVFSCWYPEDCLDDPDL